MKKVLEKELTAKKLEEATKAVLTSDVSKSQKMKDLFDLGYEVKDISEMMAVRYNFVYNVVSNYCNMNGIATESTKKEGKKDQIIEMFLAGKTNKEISIDLKTNYNYVFNTIKGYKKDHPELEKKAEDKQAAAE